MTFYARLSGYLTYRTHDHLDAAIQHLIRGAWLNTDEQWLLKGHPRQVRAESTIDNERNLLVIPPASTKISVESPPNCSPGLPTASSSRPRATTASTPGSRPHSWTPLTSPPATAATSPRFSASTSNRLRARTASASRGSAIRATNGGSATYSTRSTLGTTPTSTKSSNPPPPRPSDTPGSAR